MLDTTSVTHQTGQFNTVPKNKTATSNPDSIMERLRADTRPEHVALEAMGVPELLAKGTITPAQYTKMLVEWEKVHTELEEFFEQTKNDAICAVWKTEMRKSHLLALDVIELQRQELDASEAEFPLSFVETVAGDETKKVPYFMLGALYVTEGSTLGGMVIKKALGRNPKLTNALHFYGAYGRDTARNWAQFAVRMNALDLTDEQSDQVVAGAKATFAFFGEIFKQMEQS